VVWQNDADLQLAFPVLELESRVSKILLTRFDELMNAKSFIACDSMIGQVKEVVWVAWKERLLIERLQKKTVIILDWLEQYNYHWEEIFGG
jgi:hypothetical protein